MSDDLDLDTGLKRLHLPTIRRMYLPLQEQAEKEGWSYRDFLERLVSEVARLAGESKTEAVRRALEERRDRLSVRSARRDRRTTIRQFLEREVWPVVPKKEAGRRLPRKAKEALLGYGPHGV